MIAALKKPNRTEGVRKIAARLGGNASTVEASAENLALSDPIGEAA